MKNAQLFIHTVSHIFSWAHYKALSTELQSHLDGGHSYPMQEIGDIPGDNGQCYDQSDLTEKMLSDY